VNELERFRGAQFVLSNAARARAAMSARQIATKRDLPNHDARRGIVIRPPAGEFLRIPVIIRTLFFFGRHVPVLLPQPGRGAVYRRRWAGRRWWRWGRTVDRGRRAGRLRWRGRRSRRRRGRGRQFG
jgi:hypothetical protein